MDNEVSRSTRGSTHAAGSAPRGVSSYDLEIERRITHLEVKLEDLEKHNNEAHQQQERRKELKTQAITRIVVATVLLGLAGIVKLLWLITIPAFRDWIDRGIG